MLTLLAFGGKATVAHLAELHHRIAEDWDEQANAGCVAVVSLMEAINVDDNGVRI